MGDPTGKEGYRTNTTYWGTGSRLQKYDDMVLSCVLIMSWNEITQLFAKLRKSRDN